MRGIAVEAAAIVVVKGYMDLLEGWKTDTMDGVKMEDSMD